MDSDDGPAVNHHAAYPGCGGLVGLLGGVGMLAGGRALARRVVDLAGVSAADRVVDVGCGPGNAVRRAARTGAHATGVDPSTAMLRIARLTSRADLEWVHAGAEELPLPDASATVLWTVRSVHHWGRRRRRPGGGVPDPPTRRAAARRRAGDRGGGPRTAQPRLDDGAG